MTIRALFVNEGDLGGNVLGHVTMRASLQAGLAGRDEVEAHFVTLPDLPRLPSLLAAEIPRLADVDLDLHSTRWHAVQAVRARRLVQREVERVRPDVLHVGSHTIALGLRRRDLGGIPLFVSVDATTSQWQRERLGPRWRTWSPRTITASVAAERRLFRWTAGALAFSGWSLDGVRELVPTAAGSVLHPGIDLTRFRPGARPDRGPLRLLFVGGRFREKGGEDLLAAVEPWLDREVLVDVVTAADVPPRPGVTQHRLDQADDRLVDCYQRADLLCLPSRTDAVPWVVPEAFACGTPVLVSTTGALPSMVGDAGFVVPPRDPRAIREALARFVTDPQGLDRLRSVARRQAEDGYDRVAQAAALAAQFAAAVSR